MSNIIALAHQREHNHAIGLVLTMGGRGLIIYDSPVKTNTLALVGPGWAELIAL